MNSEPNITINGTTLSVGQAMAVRVACTAFAETIRNEPDSLGDDKHGRLIMAAYRKRFTEIIPLLLGKPVDGA